MKVDALILQVLREPRRAATLSLAQWDLLLRQARAANLLARLAWLMEAHDLDAHLPPQALLHLRGARLVAARHRQAALWEIEQVRAALAGAGLPTILLKGAAYVAADLPCAHGRLFSDIDVLVPKAQINAAEAALMLHGWGSTHHDAYDQRYYRQWMHELPPMQHGKRMTVVDVHHAILPFTARSKPDSAKLIAAARPIAARPELKTLAPVDMVLHSACHLFHEEELHHGLRDLADLDALLRAFGDDPAFWKTLPARSRELDLARPLYYALRYARRMLDTPVPEEVMRDAARGAPAWPVRMLMDGLYGRALQSPHASCADGLTGVARRLLFVRAHWLRMPVGLLVRHLGHKVVAERSEEK
ncbi:nucleotidyltransferase domain-containing protein [Noviherbaspirillum pedocola]|uniref:Nucleotidyltransferase family protein n=1 Tax=Noviherbaspirillum pedocola TaxID=2801341 RepID=A0A934SSE0_9BURK|nr:nucleotidyltransferase family protein [Noviherbaspirillum pedocola]MBK4734301.1 nucleotidyltransferase family protein [Noviherbaspirillum pedocola]